MAQYKTEQKRILMRILRDNCESAYTVDELIRKMGDNAPGKSTVYRLMTNLVEEGTVKRFVRGNSRQFVYQIVIGEHCDCHLHLKCMDCGRLIHLDERISDELLDRVRDTNEFSINEQATVLFGKCKDCGN